MGTAFPFWLVIEEQTELTLSFVLPQTNTCICSSANHLHSAAPRPCSGPTPMTRAEALEFILILLFRYGVYSIFIVMIDDNPF